MPALKSKTPLKPLAQTLKPARAPVSRALAKTAPKASSVSAVSKVASAKVAKLEKPQKVVNYKQVPERAAAASKASVPSEKSLKKDPPVPFKSSPQASAKPSPKKDAALKLASSTSAADAPVKKKPGRPPKNPAASPESGALAADAAKRGRKSKIVSKIDGDTDLSDIEAEFAEEPAVETAEKVKPLRMKISKAKERALMKEFGLDETVLSEEDMLKRRMRLKTLIKLGKTRGYLTHGEISDHLPDKLVDAETLEVVVNMLNDMGVAVYEQAPDAETLLLNNNVPTVATEEEAE